MGPADRRRTWPRRRAAPPHRAADRHVAAGRRSAAPRLARHRAGHRARPAQPHDRRPRRLALRGGNRPLPRRAPRRPALGRPARRPPAHGATSLRAPRRRYHGSSSTVPSPPSWSVSSPVSPRLLDATPTTPASTSTSAPARRRSPLRPDYEHALVVFAGACVVDGAAVEPGHLAYLGVGRDEIALTTDVPTRALLDRRRPLRRTGADVVELRRPHPRRDHHRSPRLVGRCGRGSATSTPSCPVTTSTHRLGDSSDRQRGQASGVRRARQLDEHSRVQLRCLAPFAPASPSPAPCSTSQRTRTRTRPRTQQRRCPG